MKCTCGGVKTQEPGKQRMVILGIVFRPFLPKGDCIKCKEKEIQKKIKTFQEKSLIKIEGNGLTVNWKKYCEMRDEEEQRDLAYFLLDAGILTLDPHDAFLILGAGMAIDPGINSGSVIFFKKSKDALGFKEARYPNPQYQMLILSTKKITSC
jgi:hypothetical protein